MDQPVFDHVPAAQLGRAFFDALDARDPHQLRATLADEAVFRALPHREALGPADAIVEYFGTVVSSYPNGRWEITGTLGEGDTAVIIFALRETDPDSGIQAISEQMALVHASNGRIVAMTGYYDSAEFQRQFGGTA